MSACIRLDMHQRLMRGESEEDIQAYGIVCRAIHRVSIMLACSRRCLDQTVNHYSGMTLPKKIQVANDMVTTQVGTSSMPVCLPPLLT